MPSPAHPLLWLGDQRRCRRRASIWIIPKSRAVLRLWRVRKFCADASDPSPSSTGSCSTSSTTRTSTRRRRRREITRRSQIFGRITAETRCSSTTRRCTATRTTSCWRGTDTAPFSAQTVENTAKSPLHWRQRPSAASSAAGWARRARNARPRHNEGVLVATPLGQRRWIRPPQLSTPPFHQ